MTNWIMKRLCTAGIVIPWLVTAAGASFAQDSPPPTDTCDGYFIQDQTFESLTLVGESCYLQNVTINGDLTVINSKKFSSHNSEVHGNIKVQSSGEVGLSDTNADEVLVEDNASVTAQFMIVDSMQIDRNQAAYVFYIGAGYLDCQDNLELFSGENQSASGNNCRRDINPPPDPNGSVDLSGTVYTTVGEDPVPLCAMVLASGEFEFSCNPNGPYELTDLPREGDGTVKRQVYVDGFFPNIAVLEDSTKENVYMSKAEDCPDYNEPYEASESPDSAGDLVEITGQVLQGEGNTSVCAMVLANGEFMFSCDGSGNYALNIPLDDKGQFKLQVYADGFAPNIQVFDEFKRVNDVRMAPASECN